MTFVALEPGGGPAPAWPSLEAGGLRQEAARKAAAKASNLKGSLRGSLPRPGRSSEAFRGLDHDISGVFRAGV